MRLRCVGAILILLGGGCGSQRARNSPNSNIEPGASESSANVETGEDTTAPSVPCEKASDCRGGEFCDRGQCAATQTRSYGHGYGAQCVDESFYSNRNGISGRWVHCDAYPCVDGHCSSCVADDDCIADGNWACRKKPFQEGQLCALLLDDAVVTERPEPVPETFAESTLVGQLGDDCEDDAECHGDEFCDRGLCQPILVDQFGHGYGAECQRIEQPSPEDSCVGYLCVNHRCQSCLDDSECYPLAPYCIERHPFSVAGRQCSPNPESYYFDEDGNLREERAEDYAHYAEEMTQLSEARVEAGLAPFPPFH